MSLDPRTQKPRFAVEIKWSDRAPAAPHELRGLVELAAKHRLVRKPLVTTRTYTGEAHIDGIDIEFMPVVLHCYTIDRNLLRVIDCRSRKRPHKHMASSMAWC